MLILTRKMGQQIVVGNNIYVTILEIQGNKVRIGVTAPKGVSVHREEIHQRIQQAFGGPRSTGGEMQAEREAQFNVVSCEGSATS